MIQATVSNPHPPFSFGHCPFCEHTAHLPLANFNAPPRGETPISPSQEYQRYLIQCEHCRHVRNIHSTPMGAQYYQDSYWSATYQASKNNADGNEIGNAEKQFQKIIQLAPQDSDNFYRTERITRLLEQRTVDFPLDKRLLDIGSGLAVFTYAMKKRGWHATVIDPNPIAVQHALRQNAADQAFQAIFPDSHVTLSLLGGTFALVTLNKVLEHVNNPLTILSGIKPFLAENAIVYIELPDATSALKSPLGVNRQEFFIQHYHAFSFESCFRLLKSAEFEPIKITRIREPSGKFSICAFAAPIHASLSTS